jgi:hypothetical protein
MGRRIDVHPIPRSLSHGAQIGDQRAFAIGARDMHHRRQPAFGRSQGLQQALDALQPEIDDPRMKTHDALEQRIHHDQDLET